MSGKGFVDRFGAVSGGYAAFRPTYPPPLFEWLASAAPAHRLAWDCATGSGQAALDLAAHFERVIATDASEEQLSEAPPHPHIDYRVATAEDSGLDAASLDLVTVAQALHWFDLARFFAECTRVLRPGGLLAVWCYGPQRVEGEAVDALLQRYYREIVGPYWPAERALVDAGYDSIELPFPELETPDFAMQTAWPLERLVGYLGTWSATSAYRKALGSDPLDLIRGALADAWGDPAREREMTWPLTLRAGRRPPVASRSGGSPAQAGPATR